MGGQAFSSLGLHTPRMSPDVYESVLSRVQVQLRTIYAQAETPIEGPAKPDFGDIDVLVVAKEDASQPKPEQLAKLLGAKHYTKTPNSSTTHFALPWPGDKDSADDSNQAKEPEKSRDNKRDNSQKRFIQVDVNVGPTVNIFRYTLFQHAHGDLWIILGAILRRFGFTNFPTGFYIWIAELESWNKNLARFKITDEPNTVLRYLGMNEERFWSKFESWSEAMDYASTCKFHDPRRGKQYDEKDVPFKYELKARDRSKWSKRPMFRYWLDTYLPQHRNSSIGSASHFNREEVINDMKQFFGPQVASEFDARREMGIRDMGAERLWSDVRKALPCQGSDLTYATRGLKFEVMDGKARAEVEDLEEVQRAYTDGDYDFVKKWADAHWKEVLERQKQRDRANSTAKLMEHLEKEKTRAATSLRSDSGTCSEA